MRQDRLGKALRLEGIQDLAAANEYLARTHLPEHNRKFQGPAARPAEGHRGVPPNLHETLSGEEPRDGTVVHAGKGYPLDRQPEALSLAGRKVSVRRLRDGRVQRERGGVKLPWRELPGRPQRVKVQRPRPPRRWAVPGKPAADHPWRVQRIGRVTRRMKRRGAESPPHNKPRGHF